MSMSVGEALITLLEARGVDTVFGIPGVHTVELYRGLAKSGIRHVTPRHELHAGFMADGYARVAGKPGVCFLITGPGLSNAITAMAQARADSIPMLVISGINPLHTQGHEDGHLHELPDQTAMIQSVALASFVVGEPEVLERVLDRAFLALSAGRPGPVHIDIPIDVMAKPVTLSGKQVSVPTTPAVPLGPAGEIAEQLSGAKTPLILAGGGCVRAGDALRDLAEALDAPVISTVNARGLMAGHPLDVPASPSLSSVRQVLAAADVVLALGTQMGPTDYDMYRDDGFPELKHLIRVDCDASQLTRGIVGHSNITSDVGLFLKTLIPLIDTRAGQAGAARALAARTAAHKELSAPYRALIDVLGLVQQTLPGCRFVGDSTQLTYAGNLYCEVSGPARWFNSATGYGALGYAAPTAIGAALADPNVDVVCLTGDGGLQFCLAELGTAMDEGTKVIFLVWNNQGYQEIESYMRDEGMTPIGVTPSAPDFVGLAASYGMPGERIDGTGSLPAALDRAKRSSSAYLIEINAS